jgi:hypothetical protein
MTKPGRDVNGIARTEADHHMKLPGVRAVAPHARSGASQARNLARACLGYLPEILRLICRATLANECLTSTRIKSRTRRSLVRPNVKTWSRNWPNNWPNGSSDAGTLPPARLEAVFLVGGKLAKGEAKSRTAGFLPATAGSVIFADFRPVSRSVN